MALEVGIVGLPNVGKSSLLNELTSAKSKVANYPFTTKQPILGIVEGEDFKFVMADLPGIIEGAHQGRGLGDRFLRHAERTKVLVHLIDMAGTEGRDPLEDYAKIKKELELYSDKLAEKIRLVVANKMDLPEAAENLKRFKKKYKKEKVISVSAIDNTGLDKLVEELWKLLRKAKVEA